MGKMKKGLHEREKSESGRWGGRDVEKAVGELDVSKKTEKIIRGWEETGYG